MRCECCNCIRNRMRRIRTRHRLYKRYGRKQIRRAHVDFRSSGVYIIRNNKTVDADVPEDEETKNAPMGDMDVPEFVIDHHMRLRRYTGRGVDVRIPDSVRVVCENAFGNCRKIKRVVIPQTVETIHPRAFRQCDALEEVIIMNTKIKLYGEAFLDCRILSKVYCQADDLQDYLNNAFINCNTAVRENGGPTFLPLPVSHAPKCSSSDFSIDHCGRLRRYHGQDEEVRVPYSVCAILENSFSGCDNIKRVIIPESVVVIDRAAFRRCSALEEIVFLNSTIRINDAAFEDCNALARVYSPFNYMKDRQQSAFRQYNKDENRNGLCFLPCSEE